MEDKLTAFAQLVADMRQAQKKYFNKSTPGIEKAGWLQKSKRLEREVDEALAALTIHNIIKTPKEQELFNQSLFK